jgi:AraC-like DNA-binding protein
LIERIKNVIIELIHYSDDLPKVNDSEYISEKVGYDYTYLSNIFSEVKGITIQHFIIMHKIEKVKELLIYDELTLSEIAYRLHYSSVAHLSNQFKKITGLTPTYYKQLKDKTQKEFRRLVIEPFLALIPAIDVKNHSLGVTFSSINLSTFTALKFMYISC